MKRQRSPQANSPFENGIGLDTKRSKVISLSDQGKPLIRPLSIPTKKQLERRKELKKIEEREQEQLNKRLAAAKTHPQKIKILTQVQLQKRRSELFYQQATMTLLREIRKILPNFEIGGYSKSKGYVLQEKKERQESFVPRVWKCRPETDKKTKRTKSKPGVKAVKRCEPPPGSTPYPEFHEFRNKKLCEYACGIITPLEGSKFKVVLPDRHKDYPVTIMVNHPFMEDLMMNIKQKAGMAFGEYVSKKKMKDEENIKSIQTRLATLGSSNSSQKKTLSADGWRILLRDGYYPSGCTIDIQKEISITSTTGIVSTRKIVKKFSSCLHYFYYLCFEYAELKTIADLFVLPSPDEIDMIFADLKAVCSSSRAARYFATTSFAIYRLRQILSKQAKTVEHNQGIISKKKYETKNATAKEIEIGRIRESIDKHNRLCDMIRKDLNMFDSLMAKLKELNIKDITQLALLDIVSEEKQGEFKKQALVYKYIDNDSRMALMATEGALLVHTLSMTNEPFQSITEYTELMEIRDEFIRQRDEESKKLSSLDKKTVETSDELVAEEYLEDVKYTIQMEQTTKKSLHYTEEQGRKELEQLFVRGEERMIKAYSTFLFSLSDAETSDKVSEDLSEEEEESF